MLYTLIKHLRKGKIITMNKISDKGINRKRIARYIYKKGEASKPELAAELGLSMPTVLQCVKELTATGIINEVGKNRSTGGRKAVVLSVVPTYRLAAGIDITANHISYVVIDLCGDLILKKRIKAEYSNTAEYYELAAEGLEAVLDEADADRSILLGVGISFPGIIDKENEILLRSHVLGQDNLSLRAFSQLIPYDTEFDNDANSALFAEMRYIEGDMIYLSLSNSVGGSIYINSSVYPGDNYRSAEFGHIIIERNGKSCYCGKKGCADAYCSARVLEAQANSLEDFFVRLEKGKKRAREVWDLYLDSLAVVISNLRMTFDCDIMLGGYVGGYLRQYMPELRRRVVKYNMFENDTLYIKTCIYEKEASAVGAAMHFTEKFFDNI